MARNIEKWRNEITRRGRRDPFATSPWFYPFSLWDNPFLDELTTSPLFDVAEGTRTLAPVCDLQETDSHFVLSLEMPGVPKENINVETTGDQITVSGERRTERSEEKGRGAERIYGRFRRTFTLPAGIDREKIEANYCDGILELMIPKGEAMQSRKIAIGEGTKGQLASSTEKKEEKAAPSSEKAA